ncbi:MAG: cytidine deaminase, partial [Actinobacteria bacterium]|nr:cytidine deaminase [Actinomycetota bacterium]
HRETKLLFVCHAERNALDNSPMSVEGCIMYVPLMPCNECAKSIIQRGA